MVGERCKGWIGILDVGWEWDIISCEVFPFNHTKLLQRLVESDSEVDLIRMETILFYNKKRIIDKNDLWTAIEICIQKIGRSRFHPSKKEHIFERHFKMFSMLIRCDEITKLNLKTYAGLYSTILIKCVNEEKEHMVNALLDEGNDKSFVPRCVKLGVNLALFWKMISESAINFGEEDLALRPLKKFKADPCFSIYRDSVIKRIKKVNLQKVYQFTISQDDCITKMRDGMLVGSVS
jgi:hypothetical protein